MASEPPTVATARVVKTRPPVKPRFDIAGMFGVTLNHDVAIPLTTL
jgi:hypothetical protein